MGVVIRAEGIQKRFGATMALKEGAMEVVAGRVHALLGENGAGKSTMTKILAGQHRPDAGTLTIDGQAISDFTHWNTRTATRLGIAAVYQELSLPPHLSVAESIFLGVEREALSLSRGLIRPRRRAEAARTLLEACDLAEIPVDAPVGELSLALQQMVEVAKALARKPRILLLDEATSSLPEEYVQKLFRLIARLKADGMALIFISHRLDEVDQIADEATIFRDGARVGNMPAPFDRQRLIDEMAGHPADEPSSVTSVRAKRREGTPLLSVQGLTLRPGRPSITVDIHGGEIIGVAGLEGHGQQEFLASLYGAFTPVEGVVRVKGERVRRLTPRHMIRRGVVLIPQSRKTEALHLDLSIQENVTLMALRQFAVFGWLNMSRERRAVESLTKKLTVRMNRLDDPASSLSGGNQQKLVFAKVLLTHPDVILMVDPMRGVDVATKSALYDTIRQMAQTGKAIVIYSSDTAELAEIASRVLVFYEHNVVGELAAPDISNEALVEAAFHRKGTQTDDVALAEK